MRNQLSKRNAIQDGAPCHFSTKVPTFLTLLLFIFFNTSPCGLTLVYVEADNEFYSLFYKNQTVLSLF